ncbi:hypothetical protein KAFR_0F01440 [Kazachstania africana CBS 2517]|uniref:DNA polymerase n=1 Tax=Kazachstania africana (strain ATCC 22294 / BCRC 22015 / CBS 2517 / CECT 1963 / NBRC 1671 / NRRL Y-8276) TaxID=1071382 RepID=H2AWJ0_KAZAF|nr:hypothetical protein KAFR_0F01440 [Kazachstania africana CBS 2517]CCF58740.1 hypothetical protein KAFR_0F01440 [Kazachstania africana CBS 2517]
MPLAVTWLMLFEGLKFFLLPNATIASLGFLSKVIENKGGEIVSHVDALEGSTIFIISDSFIDSSTRKLTQLDFFQKELEVDFDKLRDIIDENNIKCISSGFITGCIKANKFQINDSDLIEISTDFVSSSSESAGSIEKNISANESQEETDIEGSSDIIAMPKKKVKLNGSEMKVDNLDASEPVSNNDTPGMHVTDLIASPSRAKNALLLDAMSRLYQKYETKGDKFRAKSYKFAKTSIEQCPFVIESGKQAQEELQTIGPSIAKKIQTILDFGTLPGLTDTSELETKVDYFKTCHGVGPHRAKRWHLLRYESFSDVLRKAPEEMSNDWPILFGWSYFEEWSKRITRKECNVHLEIIKEELERVDPSVEVEIQGSYIRGASTCGDIDLLFFKPNCDDMNEIATIFESLACNLFRKGFIQCCLQLTPALYELQKYKIKERFEKAGLKFLEKGNFASSKYIKTFYFGVKIPISRYICETVENDTPLSLLPDDKFMAINSGKGENPCRRLDFFSCKWSELGAARIQWTGPTDFNRWIRVYAAQKGFRLTQHGLSKDGKLIESFDEKRIFELLDLEYTPRHLRAQGLWKKGVKERT